MTTTLDTNIVEGALVATVDELGNVKPIVIMEDEPIHTAENGYRCQDRSCPCWAESRERLPLHSARPFSLLR